MKWGLLDTEDRVWIGNDDGPHTYDDETFARVVAQMFDVMMKWKPARTRATVYVDQPKVLHDTVTPTITAEDALKGIEEGRYP